jgi:hypothetical protein
VPSGRPNTSLTPITPALAFKSTIVAAFCLDFFCEFDGKNRSAEKRSHRYLLATKVATSSRHRD